MAFGTHAFAFFVFLTLLSSIRGEHVIALDKSNFDDVISKSEFAIVEFYAPWCGHCKSLEPEYEKAAGILKEEGSNVILTKVDADNNKNKKLAKKYGVSGFPTIKIIRNGVDVQDYNGPRDADGIVSYVKKLSGPASSEVSTAEEVSSLVDQNSVLVVGVFPDFEGEDFKGFQAAASTLRDDNTFVHSKDPTIFPLKDEPLVAPTVRVYKNFDEGFNDAKTFDKDSLVAFINKHSLPLVVEMDQKPENRPHLEKVFKSTKPKVLLFFDYEDEILKTSLTSAFRAVAKEPHDVDFIIGSEKENSQAIEYFGSKAEDSPLLLIHDQSTDKKYVKEKAKPEEIASFVADYESGKLTPKIKSEPIPESNDGPVTVVVRDTLEDIVFNSKKNVLIEFYAPWCGHCKKLAPIFDKVGEYFKDDDSIVVAKLDATANDLPKDKFDVSGFPTLFFVDAEGSISLYEGGRTKKDLVSYIKKHKKESPANKSVEQAETPAPSDSKDEL